MDMAPYYLTALSQVFGPLAGVAALGSSSGPTRTIGQGPRAGEAIDVEVATYVTAIYDFRTGGVTQATFSFDSPLARVGVLEIAGTEATLATPDPNKFTGDIRVNKAGADDWQTIPATGVDDGAGFGRGIGVVDMARALRGGGATAPPENWRCMCWTPCCDGGIGAAPRICRHQLQFCGDPAAARGLGPHPAGRLTSVSTAAG